MSVLLTTSSRFSATQASFSAVVSRLYHYKHHALLIGGGVSGQTVSCLVKPHLSEKSEYSELKLISDKFKQIKEAHSESPKILFGNGKDTSVMQYPGSIANIWCKIMGTQNIFPADLLENLKGSASLENISREFNNLASQLKPGDHLLIYITGHGLMFRGTVLWNELLTTEYLSPKFLQSELQKLPQGVSIKLYVDSCYSGIYQQLSSLGITVFSTSTDTNTSLYTPGEVNKSTLFMMDTLYRNSLTMPETNSSDCFDGNESNLLIPFSLGSIQSNNFCATDSLSHFLDTHLKGDEILFKVNRVWKEFKQEIATRSSPMIGAYASGMIVGIACAYDRTGTLTAIFDLKLASIFGKAALPFVKPLATVALATAFPKLAKKISSKWEKTYLYKNWHVLNDQRLIRKLASNQQPTVSEELTEPEKKLMLNIFQALEKLKTIRSTDERYSHYYYLYDKAVLFTLTASLEKSREFIQIAQPLVLYRS